MRRFAAAVLVAASFAALPVCATDAGRWQILTREDKLDSKSKSTSALLTANETVTQFGRALPAYVIVDCYRPDAFMKGRPYFTAILRFPETVVIGERQVRWRVDELPIRAQKARFWDDGKHMFLGLMAKDTFVAEMRRGKSLKVEADLPWAGNSLLTFDLDGADAAIAQIPCGATIPPKKK